MMEKKRLSRVSGTSRLGDRILDIVPAEEPGRPLADGAMVSVPDLGPKDLDLSALEGDGASILRLVSELSALPAQERKEVIEKCLQLIRQRKSGE